MYAPDQIDPNYRSLDLIHALWQFHTTNYSIALFAEEEDLNPADSFCDPRDIEFASDGDPAHWFCAVIAVYGPTGERIGVDTLGGCSYNSFHEFYGDHRNSNPAYRNCSIQQWYSRKDGRKLKSPRRGKYQVCHYFHQMVREALNEARATELRKQFVAA